MATRSSRLDTVSTKVPVRMPKRIKPNILQQTIKLFEEYRQGKYSVRQLAEIHQIPFSSLRDRFRSVYGINYTSYRSGEGTTYRVIQETINQLPPGKHRAECELWLERNREKLLSLSYEETQSTQDPRLFTSSRLDRDSKSMCRFQTDLASSPFLGNTEYAPGMVDIDGSVIYLHERY